MSFSNVPDFQAHDSLLLALSTLNVRDKLEGYEEKVGAMGERGRKVVWVRQPEGFLQGPLRTTHNLARMAVDRSRQLGAWVYQKGREVYGHYMGQPNEPVEPPSPPREESAQQDNPLMADARSVAMEIRRDFASLAGDVENCAVFIHEAADVNTLRLLEGRLTMLQAEIKTAQSGLQNLQATYIQDSQSYKAKVTTKYQEAGEELNAASQSLGQSLNRVEELIAAVRQKTAAAGAELPDRSAALRMGLSTPAVQGSSSLAIPGNTLPEDFPISVEMSPKNMLVAVRNFLSNPVHWQQPDDRQISCAPNGELSLYTYRSESPLATRMNMHNFIEMMRTTYGNSATDYMQHCLDIQPGAPLTWGDVKNVLVMMNNMAHIVAPSIDSSAAVLQILEPEKRRNPSAADVEFALRNIPHGQISNDARIVFPEKARELVGKADIWAMENPFYYAKASSSSSASASAPPRMVAPQPPVAAAPPPPPPPPPPPGVRAPPPPPPRAREEAKIEEAAPAAPPPPLSPEEELARQRSLYEAREEQRLLRGRQERLSGSAFKNSAKSLEYWQRKDPYFSDAMSKLTNDELKAIVGYGLTLVAEDSRPQGPWVDEAVAFYNQDSNLKQELLNFQNNWRSMFNARGENFPAFVEALKNRLENPRAYPEPVYAAAPFDPSKIPPPGRSIQQKRAAPADRGEMLAEMRRAAQGRANRVNQQEGNPPSDAT